MSKLVVALYLFSGLVAVIFMLRRDGRDLREFLIAVLAFAAALLLWPVLLCVEFHYRRRHLSYRNDPTHRQPAQSAHSIQKEAAD